MKSMYEEASIAFEEAVDKEAARLIESGVASPWIARGIARENVLAQRRLNHFSSRMEKKL